ncbi:MAG: RNA 2',3'-cyclic phosphodiesterase [Bdellovibrio sp.]
MTKRLFFAVNASDPLSKTFLPTYKKLKINADKQDITVKWVQPDNFHITVTFLGPQPEEKIPALEQALNEACEHFAPFDLKIEDVGAFSNEHEARVLWLGVQNKKVFGDFKQTLEENLLEKQLITQTDEREFNPHLTIGRLRNPRSVKDMISPFKRKSFGKIRISEIILYESQLQGNYPVYIPLYKCKLKGQIQEVQSEMPNIFPRS